ncbi:hypothetical protein QQ045_003870 [Rhodiola kirilowii]
MAEEANSQEANLQLLAKFAQMTQTQGALQSDPLSLSNSDNPTMQGNLSVTAYYSKLKKCWDELQYMNGVPACTCGALGKCTCRVLDRMKELESQDKLMQFLANLNGEYDSVKSQILSSDPLPSVSKAYYTVLQVEKQKQIGSTVPESTALMAGLGAKGNTNHRTSYSEKRDNSKECFEIIGYPDWYKGKQNKRSQGYSSRVASHVDRGQNSTPLDHDEEESVEKYDHLDPKFVKAMCSEMMKVFKSKMPTPNITNFSEYEYSFDPLELPVCLNGRNLMMLNYIEDRIWKRIHGWKEKLLSVAAKDVLIKIGCSSHTCLCIIMFQIAQKSSG